MLHRGRVEGTSLTPTAAGCGGTHCGSQALQGEFSRGEAGISLSIIQRGSKVPTVLSLTEWDSKVSVVLTEFSSPLPRHPALAVGPWLVEVTGSTRGLIHHC